MPLYKKAKSTSKTNQGAQMPRGSAGNIKYPLPNAGGTDKGKRAPRNNPHGRNKSIGR